MSTTLPDYGGRPVTRTAIKITNAGDGLSQGLAIDPTILDVGSTKYVVLECVVDSHEHDRILDKGNDTGLLVLNQVLKAGTGTLIDADVVKAAIADQATKIEQAREAERIEAERAKGVHRLDDAVVEQYEKEHAEGVHAAGRVAGCPPCDAEVAAERAEKEAEPPAKKASGRKRAPRAQA